MAKHIAGLTQAAPSAALKALVSVLAPVASASAGRWVFVAPDGPLHALPFAALPLGLGRWVDRRSVALVESVASVLRPSGDSPAGGKPAVVTADRVDAAGREGPYPPLPGARREGEAVARALGVRVQRLPPTTEALDQVRALLKRPWSILHVAGHAQVFDQAPRGPSWSPARAAEVAAAEDPYERSRLILGGFNAWAGGDPRLALDQVSLSAAELARGNLTGLRLLSLAVCFGGAGEAQSLESSASLATAARAAGAGAVVAALRAVPDRDTLRLMQRFYRTERRCGSAVAALTAAQRRARWRGLRAWSAFVIWAGPDDLARWRPPTPWWRRWRAAAPVEPDHGIPRPRTLD